MAKWLNNYIINIVLYYIMAKTKQYKRTIRRNRKGNKTRRYKRSNIKSKSRHSRSLKTGG